MTKLDRISLAIIVGGLILTIAASMALGIAVHWAISLIFIVIYFIIAGIAVRILKKL